MPSNSSGVRIDRGEDSGRPECQGRGLVGQRFSQDSEVVVRMAQCKSLPEVVGVETEWFRRAFDDYAKEANKLMEANGKLFGCFVATTEQAEPNASPLKRSTRAAG